MPLVATAQTLPSAELPWTLEETTRHAIEAAPALKEAEANAEVSVLQRRNATASFFPRLDFTSAHGLQGRGDGLGTSPMGVTSFVSPGTDRWVSGYALTLSEKLYDNGASWRAFSKARLGVELAALERRMARGTLAMNLAKAFHAYSYALKTLEVNRSQLEILRRQYKSSDLQHRQGLVPKKDVLRFRILFERAEIDELGAREEVLRSAREILRTAGLDPALADREEGALFRPVDLEARLDAGAEPPVPPAGSFPEVRAARLREQMQAQDLEGAERNLWPELALSASANYGASGYLGSGQAYSDTDGWSWNALVRLDYVLFDSGIRRREAAIERTRRRALTESSRGKLLVAEETARSLDSRLRRLRDLHTRSRGLRELEESNFAAIQDDYRNSRASYLDLADGLSRLLSARLAFYSTSRDLLDRRAEIRFYGDSSDD